MKITNARSGWLSRFFALLGPLVLLSACSTATVVTAPAPVPSSEDDDFSQLIAQLSTDLQRSKSRDVASKPATSSASVAEKKKADREFAARAKALFAPLNGLTLAMPVVGIRPFDLYDSWGNPRDGGKRKHKGIDIFAPKGTPVVAVTDGVISFIGEQPKGGQCVWLTTETGVSFYYAHLDRWAPGLYEGMEVTSGDLLGYVGNTGNARTTPAHLHFGVNDNDEMVNPYPILTKAQVVKRARVGVEVGGALGTR